MRHASKPVSFIPPLVDAAATLRDLVVGRHPGRSGRNQRAMLVSSSAAIADLAIGQLIYEQAVAAGTGQDLER